MFEHAWLAWVIVSGVVTASLIMIKTILEIHRLRKELIEEKENQASYIQEPTPEEIEKYSTKIMM